MIERIRATDTAVPARSPTPRAMGSLQRACSCGELAGVSGRCATCAATKQLGIQPRLTTSQPDDRHEREADRIADQVVSGTSAYTDAETQPLGGSLERRGKEVPLAKTAFQQNEPEKAKKKPQAKPKAAASAAPGPQVTAAVASPGRPLSRAERAWFEPRLGHDLSSVRLHDDARAGATADAINARAFTLRNHIAFSPGALDSSSIEGRRLMAHELVHTIQQSDGDTVMRKARKAKSRANLMEMVEHPDIAHKAWETTSKPDREFVLRRMRERYSSETNAKHNLDWIDEFMTIQDNGFRGEDIVHEYRHPAPDMTEDMLFRGYSLSRSWTGLGTISELWVRPSGKTVILVRDIADRKEKPGPPSKPEETVTELVPDLTESEVEDLLGFKVPHFLQATIVDEDNAGNRTIHILQSKEVKDEDGEIWEEANTNTIRCSPDDVCTADPDMFRMD